MIVNNTLYQTDHIDVKSCVRIQNFELFRKYTVKKEAFKRRSAANKGALSVINGPERNKLAIIDESINECYMWCYAHNVDYIMKGGKLRFLDR